MGCAALLERTSLDIDNRVIGCNSMFMGTFFRTPDGRLRGLRVGACCYLFNSVLSMVGDRRSLSWISWFLMAVGFFALSLASEPPLPESSKWRTPAYLVGIAAFALGFSLFVYNVSPRKVIGTAREVKTANPDRLIGTAMDAVTSFHAELARRQYADLCKSAGPNAIGSTGLPCQEFLAYVHDKLGDALETERTDAHVENRPANEPVRVRVRCATRYEHGLALENFEWRIGGMQPVLINYQIQAKALSR